MYEKMGLSEFIDVCIFMRAGESVSLADVLTFDDCNWCMSCIYDNWSKTNKLMLSYKTTDYPTVMVDIPTSAKLDNWQIWFEHILRIKSLMTRDKFVYVNSEDLKKLYYADVKALDC